MVHHRDNNTVNPYSSSLKVRLINAITNKISSILVMRY